MDESPSLSPIDSEIVDLEKVVKCLKGLGSSELANLTAYEAKLASARQRRANEKEVAPNTSIRNLSNKIDNANKQVAAARKRLESIDEEAAKLAEQRAQAEDTIATKTKLVAEWETQRHKLSSTVVSPQAVANKAPEMQAALPKLLILLADVAVEKREAAKEELATLQAACDAAKAAQEEEQRKKDDEFMVDALKPDSTQPRPKPTEPRHQSGREAPSTTPKMTLLKWVLSWLCVLGIPAEKRGDFDGHLAEAIAKRQRR